MNTVYLVRHGENPANLSNVFSYKKIDLPLTPRGRLQAQQTADYFQSLEIDEIYSSPLKRAVETAEIIADALHLPTNILDDFRELNVGLLEDMPDLKKAWEIHDEIFLGWLDGNKEARFPGGEDGLTAAARLQRGLIRVLGGKQDGRIIVVGHGGLTYTGIAGICPDVDIQQLLDSGCENCSITEIQVELTEGAARGKLIRWGDHSHIYGEAAEFAFGHPEEIV